MTPESWLNMTTGREFTQAVESALKGTGEQAIASLQGATAAWTQLMLQKEPASDIQNVKHSQCDVFNFESSR